MTPFFSADLHDGQFEVMQVNLARMMLALLKTCHGVFGFLFGISLFIGACPVKQTGGGTKTIQGGVMDK